MSRELNSNPNDSYNFLPNVKGLTLALGLYDKPVKGKKKKKEGKERTCAAKSNKIWVNGREKKLDAVGIEPTTFPRFY
jgi:hypothetical protein